MRHLSKALKTLKFNNTIIKDNKNLIVSVDDMDSENDIILSYEDRISDYKHRSSAAYGAALLFARTESLNLIYIDKNWEEVYESLNPYCASIEGNDHMTDIDVEVEIDGATIRGHCFYDENKKHWVLHNGWSPSTAYSNHPTVTEALANCVVVVVGLTETVQESREFIVTTIKDSMEEHSNSGKSPKLYLVDHDSINTSALIDEAYFTCDLDGTPTQLEYNFSYFVNEFYNPPTVNEVPLIASKVISH